MRRMWRLGCGGRRSAGAPGTDTREPQGRGREDECILRGCHETAAAFGPSLGATRYFMTDSHGMADDEERDRGTSEEPLTAPGTKAPSHAERARTLVESRGAGALATVALDPSGYPYGSLVPFAMVGADPVFLISDLAVHTKHLEADRRASLLVFEDAAADPLANARVTLVGDCVRLAEPSAARAAYLAAHPGAASYADFADFGFFGLSVASIRYIGGYGRMSWVDLEAWRGARPDPLAPHAKGILEHMNADHSDALVSYARAFTRAAEAEEVVMTAVDRLGLELLVTTERGPCPARIAFDAPTETPEAARKALVALVRAARAQLG